MPASSNNTSSSSIVERNAQILEKFTQSMKSEATQVNSIDYLNYYIRYCRLYEDGEEEEELLEQLQQRFMLLPNGEVGIGGKKNKKRGRKKKKLFYRYDLLLDQARKGDDGDSSKYPDPSGQNNPVCYLQKEDGFGCQWN